MKRASRGLDTPAGTIGQEAAAEKLFEEFLSSIGLSKNDLDNIHKSHHNEASLPTQNLYSLLTAFSIFIQTKKSDKARSTDGLLAKSTALGYFSQIVNLLRDRYSKSLDDTKRIAKIRDKMSSFIEERNLRANVQTNDAPGCSIDDLSMLVEYLVTTADVATGFKSIHDSALLVMMWHTFGRAVDTCFSRKQQLSLAASGELFLHIARIKTSVVQGVSVYKSLKRWQQCMFHAFGMLFVCYDEPSEFLFPLAPHFVESDLPGSHPYSQEEAVLYWDRLVEDDNTLPPRKRERKRPNIASYITEVIRDAVKAMPPTTRNSVTPHMTSHSIRRGAAAYANASPKLAIQWISTRGAWLLESLTKAFAYIGTTTKEDQSVAKVLAGYPSPDLPVVTPSIRDLQERLSALEYKQLITLRSELYRHVTGFHDVRFNVALEVIDATFAALLIHLEEVQTAAASSDGVTVVHRYLYELQRGVAATNARLGSSISLNTCCKWGGHLKAHWQAVNHGQIGNAVAGGDTLLASTLENVLNQLVLVNEKLGRLEDTYRQLIAQPPFETPQRLLAQVHPRVAAAGTPPDTPAIAMTSTLAGCLLNWYTNHIWETVKGKKEQNKRADSKAAINIMLILYQKPLEIPAEPVRSHSDGETSYQQWKNALWTLAVAMDAAVNECLYALDQRKPTRKAASLRKRWKALKLTNPDAVQAIVAQFLQMKANGQVIDACTPETHLWKAKDLV
ncbi:hypothetical protein P3T76_015934 [Phytophthora citrophthora]|uniref:Uncharacterized protein n=2 Tax=Phytophthora citrophthora TaxID=4793 RepID=A0AAD9FYU3_9STRA|nr:hypothetical protein P3T76_015934 [Phytophthora citrophthora]